MLIGYHCPHPDAGRNFSWSLSRLSIGRRLLHGQFDHLGHSAQYADSRKRIDAEPVRGRHRDVGRNDHLFIVQYQRVYDFRHHTQSYGHGRQCLPDRIRRSELGRNGQLLRGEPVAEQSGYSLSGAPNRGIRGKPDDHQLPGDVHLRLGSGLLQYRLWDQYELRIEYGHSDQPRDPLRPFGGHDISLPGEFRCVLRDDEWK